MVRNFPEEEEKIPAKAVPNKPKKTKNRDFDEPASRQPKGAGEN